MRLLTIAGTRRHDTSRPGIRTWDTSRPRDGRPPGGTYLRLVAERPSLDVRRHRFARFVERALTDAAATRGWDRSKVSKESGCGRTTLYRWLGADWTEDPQAAKVRDFCDALDIPPQIPFAILWPGRKDRPAESEPAPLDPDVQTVLRKLADPSTDPDEVWYIRETLHALATRYHRRRRAS